MAEKLDEPDLYEMNGEERRISEMSLEPPERIVVFGATGHLGREVLARLDDADWATAEIVGVVSAESETTEFEARGELFDALSEPPMLRSGDLVFVCTPGAAALEIVRSALQAEAPCIDCTGVMAEQVEVSMPVLRLELAVNGAGDSDAFVAAKGPLLAVPGATTLAWASLLDGLNRAAGVRRVVATVMRSASALGRRGVVALSEESIALFNQSEAPAAGPSGQTVAFDVVPDTESGARTSAELERLFPDTFQSDVASVQVPTFVGEGASLAVELSKPLDAAALVKTLGDLGDVEIVDEGVGTRGLARVEPGVRAPTGPTLRDAAGADGTLVGGLRPDASLPVGLGWRFWLSYDPVVVAAKHAVRLAALRFAER